MFHSNKDILLAIVVHFVALLALKQHGTIPFPSLPRSLSCPTRAASEVLREMHDAEGGTQSLGVDRAGVRREEHYDRRLRREEEDVIAEDS